MQRLLDHFAMWTSGLCLVHCLAMPVLLVVMPILTSTTLADEQFHALLLAFILPSSVVALMLGCRRHKDRLVIALGLSGLALLAATSLLGHRLLGEVGEKLATVLGGAILITGHYRNHRLCLGTRCEE